MQTHTQANTLLFEGLEAEDIQKIYRQMRPQHFRAGEVICREGEQGNSLFVISSGAAQVVVGPLTEANSRLASRSLARLRRGDVVGEMSLLTGEPRSATVIASIPTTVLELTQEAFAAILAQYPVLVTNLSRILSRRLALTNTRQAALRQRHEAVALVIDRHGIEFVQDILAATKSASPYSVEILDLTSSPLTGEDDQQRMTIEATLAILDDLLLAHTTVLGLTRSDQEDLPLLLKQMDRIVAVVNESEAARLAVILKEIAERVEVALLTGDLGSAPRTIEGMRI